MTDPTLSASITLTLAIVGAATGALSLFISVVSVLQNRKYATNARLHITWRPYLYPTDRADTGEVVVVLQNRGVAPAEAVELWFPEFGTSHGENNLTIDRIDPGRSEIVRVPLWMSRPRAKIIVSYAGLFRKMISRGPRRLKTNSP